MEETMILSNKIHQGKNVKRFREMLGMKQEGLAIHLGEDWHQKRVSLLESREVIEPEVLAKIAIVLNIPEEVIRSFDEESAVNYFNSFNGTSMDRETKKVNGKQYQDCSFNPLDKLIEAIEENKMLYERLLASEREKVEMLKSR